MSGASGDPCCSGSVTVSATGEMAEKCPECLGEFEFMMVYEGKPVYINAHDETLEYWSSSKDWEVFISSKGLESEVTEVGCPVDVTTWKYGDRYNSVYSNPGADAPVTVTCTPSSTPTPATPTTTTTTPTPTTTTTTTTMTTTTTTTTTTTATTTNTGRI